jgi:CheY-like chemotaxis protein
MPLEDRNYRIALVDDEPKITKLLKLVVEENFTCTVEVFNDPTKALARLREVQFDAISLDHRMPNLSGMDLVKLLRTSLGPNQKTRILLLTGYREEAECAHLDLLDEVIFLEKPIDEAHYLRWMKFVLLKKEASESAS